MVQDAAAHAAGSPPEAAHAVGFESLSAAEQETYHQEHAAEEPLRAWGAGEGCKCWDRLKLKPPQG